MEKDKNIWDNFNFDKIDDELKKEKQLEKKEMEPEYMTILQWIVDEKIGNLEGLELEYNSGSQGGREGISIMINRMNLETLYLEGKQFLIVVRWGDLNREPKVYKFTNKDTYKDYVSQVVDSFIPKLIEYYKSGFIKSLEGTKLSIDEEFNIEIYENEFKEMFNTIAEEWGNCETAEEIDITFSDDKTEICFEIDCDRYGVHDADITITNRGDVRMNMPEVIEGGDIDGRVKEELQKFIKTNKVRKKYKNVIGVYGLCERHGFTSMTEDLFKIIKERKLEKYNMAQYNDPDGDYIWCVFSKGVVDNIEEAVSYIMDNDEERFW